MPLDPYYLNPFYRNPDHPNFNRRAFHHDYTRPARYLITLLKRPEIAPFSSISGNPFTGNKADIQVNLSHTGIVIPDIITRWMKKYPIFIEDHAIMPDHLHLCMNVAASLPNGLSRAVANLMGMITSANAGNVSEKPPVFSKGYNDRIAYTIEQWRRQLYYTADNPRRYLMKKAFPDYLLRKWLLTVPDNRLFVLKGNIFLLRQPALFQVKTSRHYTKPEAETAFEVWRRRLYNGEIPISPFIHPHEKQLRDLAFDEGFAYIRICTNGFAERESASGREFDLMAQGRILLIGRHQYTTREDDLRYDYASSLNRLAKDIADSANTGSLFYIRPLS